MIEFTCSCGCTKHVPDFDSFSRAHLQTHWDAAWVLIRCISCKAEKKVFKDTDIGPFELLKEAIETALFCEKHEYCEPQLKKSKYSDIAEGNVVVSCHQWNPAYHHSGEIGIHTYCFVCSADIACFKTTIEHFKLEPKRVYLLCDECCAKHGIIRDDPTTHHGRIRNNRWPDVLRPDPRAN
jgi:hypothetical protein